VARSETKEAFSPATVNKLITTTAAIFDEAIRLGKIKRNSAAKTNRLGVGLIEAHERDGLDLLQPAQVYSAGEISRLIEKAEPALYQTLIMVVALTGFRHGGALVLQWGDLDFVEGTITVRRNWPDIYDPTSGIWISASQTVVRRIEKQRCAAGCIGLSDERKSLHSTCTRRDTATRASYERAVIYGRATAGVFVSWRLPLR